MMEKWERFPTWVISLKASARRNILQFRLSGKNVHFLGLQAGVRLFLPVCGVEASDIASTARP